MEVLKTIITIVLVIVSILLTILVLMQEGKTQGLGSLGGGMNDSSYWGKNKSRSMEGALEKITKVLAVIFFILAFALNLKWLN
jgi:preprotein translocase subunit SecG